MVTVSPYTKKPIAGNSAAAKAYYKKSGYDYQESTSNKGSSSESTSTQAQSVNQISSGKSTEVIQRRGEKVIITKQDGKVIKTEHIPTKYGEVLTRQPSVNKKADIDTPLRIKQEKNQDLGRPILYGEGYDPLGISFYKEQSSTTPSGSITKFQRKTYYPANQNVTTTTSGSIEKKRIIRDAPPPEVMYEDTRKGRLYAKIQDLESKELKVAQAQERLINRFRSPEYTYYFGQKGGEVASQLLSQPAKLTAGFGGDLYLAGLKTSLMLEAYTYPELRSDVRKEERAAIKRIPGEVFRTYDPRTSEGIANIATAGLLTWAIGKGRSNSRSTTPAGDVTVYPRIKSYDAEGVSYSVQKGEFTSMSGQGVRFEYRTGLREGGEGTGLLRLKNKNTGEIILEKEVPLSVKTSLTPKLDAYGQNVEGMFKYSQEVNAGGKKSFESGELRTTDFNKQLREDVKEFSRSQKGGGRAGLEVSKVRTQGDVIVRDITVRSEGALKNKRAGIVGKRGTARIDAFGRDVDLGIRSGVLDAEVKGLSRSPDLNFGRIEDVGLIGGKYGGRGLPASLAYNVVSANIESKSVVNSFSRGISKIDFKTDLGGLSLGEVTGLTGGEVISDYTGITDTGSVSRGSSRIGGGGKVDIDFRPVKPDINIPIAGLPHFNLPLVRDKYSKKSKKSRPRKGKAYTPSFALLASSGGFGLPKIKVPRIKNKRAFTGFELRG